jgi:hypothetical protein
MPVTSGSCITAGQDPMTTQQQQQVGATEAARSHPQTGMTEQQATSAVMQSSMIAEPAGAAAEVVHHGGEVCQPCVSQLCPAHWRLVKRKFKHASRT